MICFVEASEKVISENASYGYVAGKLEIANDIWVNHMNPTERMEIMNITKLDGLNELGKLRECVKTIASMF